ncbi:acyl-CoA carboxylase subunit epsilon [Streptomyces morookaense]|uniref:acyl-CoA carboxylase subunit epsilon n=1 Tax=Streptomyces morookaense TaxID=1970 RepID=UPI0033DBF5AF
MPEQTFLTVVRGHPDEAELAAVTVVLLARLSAAGPAGARTPRRALWGRSRFRPCSAVTWAAP